MVDLSPRELEVIKLITEGLDKYMTVPPLQRPRLGAAYR